MSKILIVDDDEQVRAVYTRFLEEAGYEVATARDGLEGLQAYREQRPDLVIMDIIMPEQEGLGAIRELREEDKEIKIIAISGGGRIDPADYLSVARTFGANVALAKPIERSLLLDKVSGLLKPE